jgi:hypothetical protein
LSKKREKIISFTNSEISGEAEDAKQLLHDIYQVTENACIG